MQKFSRLGKLRYFVIGDGKSGTVTCFWSLLPGGANGRSVLHAHGDEYLWSVREPALRGHHIGLGDLQRFTHTQTGVKPLIIYTFREPVGRTISAFFEQHVDRSVDTVQSVCAMLNQQALLTEDYHLCDHPKFFDGFDAYAHDFDKERGWSLYETDHARVLLLKFERISDWPEAIRSALSDEEQVDFCWRPGYLTSEKPCAELYAAVKDAYQPRRSLLNRKFARHERFLEHFYTTEEIAVIKDKWYSRCQ